eukprot:3473839-Prymnesium_polylepis.2
MGVRARVRVRERRMLLEHSGCFGWHSGWHGRGSGFLSVGWMHRESRRLHAVHAEGATPSRAEWRGPICWKDLTTGCASNLWHISLIPSIFWRAMPEMPASPCSVWCSTLSSGSGGDPSTCGARART